MKFSALLVLIPIANNKTSVEVYIAESGPSGPEKNSNDPSEADNIEGKGL